MRKTINAGLCALLVAIFASQTAAASGPHHTRTKGRAVASEQFRNSNAYDAPGMIAVPSNGSNEAEGAMTSGIAGH
jgi:hypothetical protein